MQKLCEKLKANYYIFLGKIEFLSCDLAAASKDML